MPKFLSNYKDKEKATKARNEQRKRYYEKNRANDERSRNRWTDDEKYFIMTSDLTDVEISKIIHRSVQSIQVKRAKMKANHVDKIKNM